MMKCGLTSVTFRSLPPGELIALAAQAGLDGIEWGGDIHVPCGDLAAAETVGKMTRDAGPEVISYGSYYRADSVDTIDALIATARALGAPHIRVWAGCKGSEEASVTEVAANLAVLCDRAGELEISVEKHRDTLTDTAASALELVRVVDRKNFRCYFQSHFGADNLASLKALIAQVSHVHVFHMDASGRRPLREGAGEWKEYIQLLRGRERAWLLEFVMGNSVEQFFDDARCLKEMLEDNS